MNKSCLPLYILKRDATALSVVAALLASVGCGGWQYREKLRLEAERAPILPEMVEIPAGRFTLGAAPGDEEAEQWERPPHEVVFKNPFKIGKYEVAFAE